MSKSVNKVMLADRMAERLGIPKVEALEFIEGLFATILERLVDGDEVRITGFGEFHAKDRHARGGVNPRKPTERIQMPATRVAKFKAGKTLKEALKESVKKE